MTTPRSNDLEDQLSLAGWSDRRGALVHLVGLLSIPVAVLARWPHLGSELARRAVLVPWLFAVLAAAWAVSNELWLARRLVARWRAHAGNSAHDDPVT